MCAQAQAGGRTGCAAGGAVCIFWPLAPHLHSLSFSFNWPGPRHSRQRNGVPRRCLQPALEAAVQAQCGLPFDQTPTHVPDCPACLPAGVIAILVVQAIVALTLLHLWQLKLVVDVERARLRNVLALIGLPGPILRIMHAKPVLVRALPSTRT